MFCCVFIQDTSSTNHMQLRRTRRSRIPDKPNYSLNLWSIMKNCIGKDLSKIPMPVNKSLVFVLSTNYLILAGLPLKSYMCDLGKLQWAVVDAAASDGGSGVQRASGPGSSLRFIPGADVPCGCLLCLFLLYHCPSYSQALQPSSRGDLWVGPSGWVWLSLHLWAGKTESYFLYLFFHLFIQFEG